ncbi:hypothetical protein MTQ01_02595 [Streptomyces sp. XM4193]|uniref:hypothetical protein n=1 Tax=Streptomyces sp. XM4193 TaxID=2929782 RepID=UPI001FF83AE7|nr:hypothetical protein [Streptomyces sp. XM4193]MCK1794930.1 hypothetical protein [Streptomyces sp. XM4193]
MLVTLAVVGVMVLVGGVVGMLAMRLGRAQGKARAAGASHTPFWSTGGDDGGSGGFFGGGDCGGGSDSGGSSGGGDGGGGGGC